MKNFLKAFSTYLKLIVVFVVIVIVAGLDYYSFYERTRKIEVLEALNDRLDTVRVSIIKLEYTLDMFIVARRFEETTVALIKRDIIRLDTELGEIITNPKYFHVINENIMLSDGLVSVAEDWLIVKSEIGSLNEASTQAEVMLIHNAVDLKTILIQEVADRLVTLMHEMRNQVLHDTRTGALWTIGGFISALLIGFFFLYKRIISQARETAMTAMQIKSTEGGARFAVGRGIMGSLAEDLNSMLDELKKDGEAKLRENEALEQFGREKSCQIAAFMALNTVASASLSQDKVLEAGVKEVVRCGSIGAAMVYLDDEHGLRLRASCGMNRTFSSDGAIIPQFIKSIRTDPETTVDIYDTLEEFPNERFGALVKSNGYASLGSVPIHSNGTLYGYLYIANTSTDPLNLETLPFIEAIASSFGTYIGYISRFRQEYDSKHFLEMLINQLPVGVAVYDRSGTCRMINSKQKKFLGVGNDDLVGSFRVFEDDVLVEQGMVTSIRKSYEGFVTEFIINYDPGAIKRFYFNGTPKKLRIKSIPLYDSGGEISNIALLYEEMTDKEESAEGAG
ncbi:MAG: GAF domain-containing protein [Proteobacteria bacterium]|nr:GAF domain-containing protein [Pseudomonadota bacterium]